jgi:quinol monooxygenase YgiN
MSTAEAHMIHVAAIITTKPGMRAEVLKHFKANVPAVHAEDGCIEYVPVVDAPSFGGFQTAMGPDAFLVIEKWRDADALRAHAAAPHMAAYAAKVKEMIAARTIHVLENA